MEFEGYNNEGDSIVSLDDFLDSMVKRKKKETIVEDPPWWKEETAIFYNRDYVRDDNLKTDLEESEIYGIYFGCYTSRGTRIFTKFLNKFYTEIQHKTLKKFQLLFCSLDENEEDCIEFVRETQSDWLVIPWDDQSSREAAKNQCQIASGPALVILKNQGSGIIISSNGKDDIMEMGEKAVDKWQNLALVNSEPEPLEETSAETIETLLSKASNEDSKWIFYNKE